MPLIIAISCPLSFLKASLSGAKTVMFLAELRVLVSSALLISAASVVISGLWLAAVTTGSMAIPCMLPIPAAGIIPQSVPMVAADSAMDPEGDAAAWLEDAGAAPVVLPQAAAVTASAQAITGIAAARPRWA